MRKAVYLAGPIAGLDYESAISWRDHSTLILSTVGIETLCPLRGKSFLRSGGEIGAQGYDEKAVSTQKGIVTKGRFDVMRAGVMLVNLHSATRVSIGTMVELGWADAFRIPTVTILDNDNAHDHLFVRELSSYVVSNLDDALSLCATLLGKDLDNA